MVSRPNAANEPRDDAPDNRRKNQEHEHPAEVFHHERKAVPAQGEECTRVDDRARDLVTHPQDGKDDERQHYQSYDLFHDASPDVISLSSVNRKYAFDAIRPRLLKADS